jgi:hypothetical protein
MFGLELTTDITPAEDDPDALPTSDPLLTTVNALPVL